MLSTFYRVSIDAIVAAGDNAGFIDQQTVEKYMANNGLVPPASLVTSMDKVRANTRYQDVIEKLQLMGNIYTSNVVNIGGTVDTPPTTVLLTLEVERGDPVLTVLVESNAGANAGVVELVGEAAIIRSIALGLIETRMNYVHPVYDPTETTTIINGSPSANAAARVGLATLKFNVGGLVDVVEDAETVVSVERLPIN